LPLHKNFGTHFSKLFLPFKIIFELGKFQKTRFEVFFKGKNENLGRKKSLGGVGGEKRIFLVL
jgi:hypothetical protein